MTNGKYDVLDLQQKSDGSESQLSDLLCCPICKEKVDWCGNHKDSECEGCHWIECITCGLFDLSVNCGQEAETIESLRKFCADKWNNRLA